MGTLNHHYSRFGSSLVALSPLTKMAASAFLTVAVLGALLSPATLGAPVSKFSSQTVKADTFVASDTKVGLNQGAPKGGENDCNQFLIAMQMMSRSPMGRFVENLR